MAIRRAARTSECNTQTEHFNVVWIFETEGCTMFTLYFYALSWWMWGRERKNHTHAHIEKCQQ